MDAGRCLDTTCSAFIVSMASNGNDLKKTISSPLRNFAAIRLGLLDHLTSGRIFLLDLSTYTVLHLEANRGTGMVFTSASRIAKRFHGVSHDWVRRSLERLESRLYIKRFTVRGSPRPSCILINRYFCTDGAQVGMSLNATDTTDWRKPIYYRAEVMPRSCRGRAEVSGSYLIKELEVEVELDKTRTQKPRALPPPSRQAQQTKIEQRNRRVLRDIDVAKEIACGGEITPPASYRQCHPDVQRELATMANRKKF